MPDSDPLPPELRGLDPGELIARGLNSVQPSAGASAWLPPSPEELAALLPQYKIESLLGHGGMGAVYKGVQPELERVVAIKLLPAEVAADAQFIDRFRREARTLARLQHPHIVGIFDFGQTRAGHLYFVMEFVDGTDLRRVLRGPGLAPDQALVVIGQICDALHAAHRQGVVHRDIKPENVLLTRDGSVKLADFGLARPAVEETRGLTHTNMVLGTPDYMAPEQREGRADHRADIFALGVMLYEMLTGRPPHGAFVPASRKVPIDGRIDEVVMKALQEEPDQRYQQASEMKLDVDRIRTTPRPAGAPGSTGILPVGPAGVPPAELHSGQDTRWPHSLEGRAPWLALAALLALCVVGFFIWRQRSERPQFATVPAEEKASSAVAAMPPAVKPGSGDIPVADLPTPAGPNQTVDASRGTLPATGMSPLLGTPPPSLASTDSPRPAASTTPTPPSAIPVVAAPTPPPPAASAPVVAPVPTPSLLQTFSRQVPNITAWVLAPLEEAVPADIRQNLTFLREDIADEAKQKPAAERAASNAGYQLCNTLLTVLDERNQARVRAGFRGVEAAARTGVTSQALEARRNYMMSWPQYAREQSQRAELKSQALNNAAVMAERPKLEWSQRTAQLSKTLDNLYAQFRAALRQGAK